MSAIATRFQIKDLEEFSGVRAHTIRIWEKRYGILAPDRTDTNIRTYGVEDLKTILNVAFLNQNGYKISKIAALDAEAREQLVRQTALHEKNGGDILNSMRLAMLSFDEVLIESVSSKYREAHGFSALMEQVYIPLLEQIGVLWQTNSICPSHEHFISNIIRQKLIVATDALPLSGSVKQRMHVLFLFDDELHELGLLYLNYLFRRKGERTIYLGQAVPVQDLAQFGQVFPQELVFITILTTTPSPPEVPALLTSLREKLPDGRMSIWVAGNQLSRVPEMDVPEGIRVFRSMKALLEAVEG